MKRIMIALFSLALATLIGCASVNFDRTQTYDGVSWKISSQWVETADDMNIDGFQTFNYTNMVNQGADNPSDYKRYLRVMFSDFETGNSAKSYMDDLAASAREDGVIVEYGLLDDYVKDNAQVSVYEYKEQEEGQEEYSDYTAFVVKPGVLFMEINSPDKSILDAVLDSVTVS